MASVSAPPFPSQTTYTDSNPRNFSFRNLNKFSITSPSSPLKKFQTYPYNNFRVPDSTLICRCQKRPSDPPPPPEDYFNRRWDSGLQDVVKSVIKKFDNYMNSIRNPEKNNQNSKRDLVMEKVTGIDSEEWDWDRWKEHFEDVEEQEKIVSVLKSQLNDAVNREEFEDAAKLKVAIAAISANDTVGKVITCLNRAVEEERYGDAALMRDNAGAGLIGWWAGISENSEVPYGRIIRISAEHGRYVARSYSPRHLATAAPGVPLFEIFFTISDKGEYKQQAVYLKRGGQKSGYPPLKFSNSPDPIGGSNTLNKSSEGKSDLSAATTEDAEEIEDRDNDSDMSDEVTGFPNILRDMIPGVKVTILKVTAPGKVDRDLISKVIEQIMEEEEEEDEVEEEEDEEEKDVELLDLDIDDEVKAGSNQDQDEIEMNADSGVISDIISEERNELAVKVVIGGLVQNLSSNTPSKALLRVPARLDKSGRLSFSFTIDKDESELDAGGKGKPSLDKMATLRGPRSIDNLMSDLAKSVIKKEKIPMKVLKDVGEFINLTLNQAQNRQLLSGTTVFNRIQIPASTDLLSGLYIGSHGLYTSEVIQLRRKFGQWQHDSGNKNPQDLEFYEYVEALKLIGDSHVPAGQVAFRAKVGRQYQLPHKGIIPDEFGVVARYKGQGRLAEPGVKNPRWVDGELVVLDGKFIKGGPVVGFVYWAPEYHFLVFFHRLRLPE
ncbi:hypothetical protein C5167_020430 [Papaver somniferum]|uniref:UVR domain-containing protein n=1 Tax=Papaver somniferum TaxID=3469 RepID=A0A4Y7IV44_PAPSO|nr:protein EXECUTER 1, chloroplastic-like [Papaver somniferum]XP_026449535.1 protein EXECUTER 1, chloroplastic-like [Papaver somniferum]RZC52006.1 hypothetical protein C5167_020430 [Papaver somniferum]